MQNFFEFVKLKCKRIYYLSKILEFKNNAKKSWGIIKELGGKIHNIESSFPKKLVISKKKKKEITEITDMEEEIKVCAKSKNHEKLNFLF